MTATIPTFQNVTIRSIGNFAGGSFGRDGNPSESYEFFRVDCPSTRQATTIQELIPFTFRHLHEAIKFAYRQDQIEAERIEARQQEEANRVERIATGERLKKALANIGLVPHDDFRISRNLIPLDQIAESDRPAVIALNNPTEEFFDVRIDGELYRVRTGFYGTLAVKFQKA